MSEQSWCFIQSRQCRGLDVHRCEAMTKNGCVLILALQAYLARTGVTQHPACPPPPEVRS